MKHKAWNCTAYPLCCPETAPKLDGSDFLLRSVVCCTRHVIVYKVPVLSPSQGVHLAPTVPWRNSKSYSQCSSPWSLQPANAGSDQSYHKIHVCVLILSLLVKNWTFCVTHLFKQLPLSWGNQTLGQLWPIAVFAQLSQETCGGKH